MSAQVGKAKMIRNTESTVETLVALLASEDKIKKELGLVYLEN